MPITVKRNRLPAALDTAVEQTRYIERVTVSGITVVQGQEQEALFSVLSATGMPARGEPLAGHPDMTLRRIVLESAGGEDAVGYLYWEVDGFGGTPSASIVTESTILTTRTTNMIPGTRMPIRIPDATITINGTTQTIPADNVTVSLLFPHRVVTVQTLGAGELPQSQGAYVGKVNDAAWRGLGVAYWLISEHTSSVSKYTGYYQKRVAAISRVVEDWSEFGILRNEVTGKYVPVQQSDIDSIAGSAYHIGLTTGTKGVIRIMPYYTTNFTTFFGF